MVGDVGAPLPPIAGVLRATVDLSLVGYFLHGLQDFLRRRLRDVGVGATEVIKFGLEM